MLRADAASSPQAGRRRVTPTPPAQDNPVDLITDKGYFSRNALKELDDGLLARIKTGRSARGVS